MSPTSRSAWVLPAPFVLLLLVFWLVPLMGNLTLSLQSNELFGDSSFVGLKNYQALLKDPAFGVAIRNTLVYSACSITIILTLSLLLAHLLRAACASFRPLLSFLLLLPGLTPPIVLAILFLLVFHGEHGLLNHYVLVPLGMEPVRWLLDAKFILPALIIQAVWRWTGFMTFFMLAGLDGIPRDFRDAAQLEGAGAWHMLHRITLPLIRHILVFCGVFLFVDSFAMFSGAYVLLGGSGGTGNAGLLLVTYVNQKASFPHFQYGAAAAVTTTMLPFLLLALWALYHRSLRRPLEGLA